MEHLTVSVDDSTGEAQYLVSELSHFLIEDGSTIERASHVEPVSIALRCLFYALRALFGEYGHMASFTRAWGCKWQVNLAPVNGPMLPETYRDRQKAIDAEIAWLETNFL